ncbi:MAG: hypothetical protein RL030_1126 [Pseudomonadota bacterium]|jgi:hypothetical protein
MAEASLLNLEELFFPILELHTLTTHDVKGDRTGTMLQFGRRVTKLDNQPGKWGFGMSIATNDATSRNPPYRFLVEAYSIVSISGTPLDGEAAEKFIELHGAPLLMGAMRERLAELTARAPWGRFLVKPIPLQDPQQIDLI